jgi:hypothetical protein
VENVRLFAFTEEKGERQTVMGRRKGKNTEYNPGIPLDVTQFGTSSYKLAPRSPLAPGEYWWGTGRGKVHTFGID